jgi:tryptophan 2,3-dioxygenase
MSLTYTDYLKLDQLLSLQQPQSTPVADDELLFIVMHQTYELWFKQMLHELARVQNALSSCKTATVLDSLKRIRTIFDTLLAQLDVLNTMSPTGFLAFRGALGPSSGFQSAQFREIEFIFGFKNPAAIKRYDNGYHESTQLETRYRQPTLWDSFLCYLHHKGYPVPTSLLHRDVTQLISTSPAIQEILLAAYREDAETAHLCEYLVDLDSALQRWRWQHMKLAERMIGNRYGSGGTAGIRYLERTLTLPAFPDLWEIRNQF